jgi:5-methylcytosine-specific restriction endonuclease McrA
MNDEKFLRSRFEARWKNIEKASEQKNLKLPDKESLWNLIRQKFYTNFFCEYCGQPLLICDHTPPYYKSFSIDHRTSIDSGGTHNLSNIAIICTRCNIIKGTMSEQTYRVFLKPMLNNPSLLDQVYREMWNGRFANKLEREQKREEEKEIKKEPFPINFKESDSTLPGCIGQFGFPMIPNGPCENCRDQKVCGDTNSDIFDVYTWNHKDSFAYEVFKESFPKCLGHPQNSECQKCNREYLCKYIRTS